MEDLPIRVSPFFLPGLIIRNERFAGSVLSGIAPNPHHLTRTRQQIDSESHFPLSNAYPLWQKADVGPAIMSMRPLEMRQHGRPVPPL